MTCAAYLRPTTAETASALVLTTDSYSNDDGVDHVSAAHRAIAAAAATAASAPHSLDALEAELLAAEFDWNDHADITDCVKAENEGREITAEDEATWKASSDRHWAAVDALTAYIPKTPAELVRKAKLLTNDGDTRLRAEEQFADLYMQDAAAVARMVLHQPVSDDSAWRGTLERHAAADAKNGDLRPSELAVREALILSMCLTYGAPDDVGPATSWHDVGTDLCRLALLDEIEGMRGVGLTDDERESVRTVGDLVALVGASTP